MRPGRLLQRVLHGNTGDGSCRLCLSETMDGAFTLADTIVTDKGDITLKAILDCVIPAFPPEIDSLLSDEVCTNCCQNAMRSYKLLVQYEDTVRTLEHYVTELTDSLSMVSNDNGGAVCMLVYVKEPPIIKNPTYTRTCIKKYFVEDKIIPETSVKHAPLNSTIPQKNNKRTKYIEYFNKSESDYVIALDKHAMASVYIYADERKEGVVKLKACSVRMRRGHCEDCDMTFRNNRQLYTHMKVIHEMFVCLICTKKLPTLELLSEHKKEHCTFECDICQVGYMRKSLLMRHMEIHGENIPTGKTVVNLKCKYCDVSVYSTLAVQSGARARPARRARPTREMFNHMKSEHGIYLCVHCEKGFPTYRELCTHRRTHNRLVCTVCGCAYKQASTLACHMTQAHGERYVSAVKRERAVNKSVFQCVICPARLPSKIAHELHLRGSHPTERPYGCPQCSKRFRTSQLLYFHENRHRQYPTGNCPECDVLCASPTAIYRHMKSVCKQQDFPNETALKEHKRSAHDQCICNYCGKKYSDYPNLKRHMVVHDEHLESIKKVETAGGVPEEINMVKCKFCDERYPDIISCRAHMLSKHPAERPFPCDRCDKTFRTRLLQRLHQRSHDKLRPHHCDICNNDFVTGNALLYHKRLHTGERPYVCDACGQGYVSAGRRNAHVRTAHSAPDVQCPLCPALFHLRSYLKSHMRTVHRAGKGATTQHKARKPRQKKNCDILQVRTEHEK